MFLSTISPSPRQRGGYGTWNGFQEGGKADGPSEPSQRLRQSLGPRRPARSGSPAVPQVGSITGNGSTPSKEPVKKQPSRRSRSPVLLFCRLVYRNQLIRSDGSVFLQDLDGPAWVSGRFWGRKRTAVRPKGSFLPSPPGHILVLLGSVVLSVSDLRCFNFDAKNVRVFPGSQQARFGSTVQQHQAGGRQW